MTELQAAKAAGVSVERLQAWELGEASPTFAMLKALADVYKGPLAVLYLPEPPSGWDAMHDFRRTLESQGVAVSARFTRALDRVRMQQNVMQEIYDDDGEPYPIFDLKIQMDDDVASSALAIRSWLGMSVEDQHRWAAGGVLVPRLSALLEAREILVTQAQRVPITDMRACSVTDHPIPAILLNGADSPTAKAFSLIHELVHILLQAGGEVNVLPVTQDNFDQYASSRVEIFCNRLAAEVLVPSRKLETVLSQRLNDGSQWTQHDLEKLSIWFGVSTKVLLIHLIDLQYATWADYRRLEASLKEQNSPPSAASSEEKKIYFPLQVRDYGRRYIKEVAQAYDRSLFNAASTAEYLGVKIEKLGRLRQQASKTGA